MLKNWFYQFLYQIKTNKFFTVLNVLGLSLGIAGLIFAMLYWNDEHSYDQWNPDRDRIFMSISDLGDDLVWAGNVSGLEPYLEQFPELESYCYFENWYDEEIITYKNKKTIVNASGAQKNFFKFFPYTFIKGNPETVLSEVNSTAISEKMAQRLFGTQDPIGSIISSDKKDYVVRGVYKIEGNSVMMPEMVTRSIDTLLIKDRSYWGNFNFGLLLKVKKANNSENVRKKIEHLLYENRDVKMAQKEGVSIEEWKKKGGQSCKIILEPLTKSRLESVIDDAFPEGKGNYQLLVIMMGLSLLILLLSIVNYINLATANAIKRAKEVGVRKVLGASKNNIIRQFLFETTIFTVIAVLVALVFTELALPYYNNFLGKQLYLHTVVFYKQIILIAIVIVITAGFLPAVYVANFDTLKVLKGNYSRSKSGIWLRNIMLVLQFSVASFFIVGSYIVYQQIHFMGTKELGFKGDQIVQIRYRNSYDWKEKGFKDKVVGRYELIKHELSKIQGVKNISAGSFTFGKEVEASSSFDYHGVTVQSKNMLIDFGTLPMLQIKIKEGRDITPQFSSDTVNSILLNETAVRLMKEKNPIGKIINWNDKQLKIVGVVKDFHINGLQAEIPPMTFFHYKTIDWMILNARSIYVKLDSEQTPGALRKIEQFWTQKIDSDFPFEYDFIDKGFARSYQNFVYQRNLFSLLNIVVITIALFGLFALASYSIERRMKEIAIRKTLGAETKTLLKELSKQYVLFCLIGFVIALVPVYLLLGKWLENFVYRITISVIPFIIGFTVLLFLTLIIVLFKAYQATRKDILPYLKYE